MSEFTKFPSIDGFASVYRGQDYFDNKAVIHYGAKIKLHGTNGAVRVSADNEVFAQSRSRDITPDKDNAGFATWVKATEDAWKFPESSVKHLDEDTIYYGEWAGKGIQKGDAVTKLDDKYFFIFAIQQGEHMLVDPDAIEACIPDLDNVIVLPWDMKFETPVDFNQAEECQSFADLLTERVEKVGERDPFIYGIFGIDGPGEGWVVTPVCNPGEDPNEATAVDRYWYERMTFKVKTEGHAVKKGKAADTKFEKPEGVEEFAAMFVTEPRCQQGLTEACDGVAEPERTGAFLKWMMGDIQKEGQGELEAASLTWKDVQKDCATLARKWFLAECEKIV